MSYPAKAVNTHLGRPLRTRSTQSFTHCLLVQLLQGRPITVASHLTLRTRQGRHDLLALGARFPVSPCAFCGSLPEVFIEGGRAAFIVASSGVETREYEGSGGNGESVYDIAAW